MTDLKKIRRQLWHSLDIAFVKQWLIVAGVCIPISFLFIRTTLGPNPDPEEITAIWVPIVLVCGPVLLFCIIRTFRIFHHPEGYIFCKTTLSSPKGGSLRDTIRFTVLLEDREGNKFAADTHSIFHTRSGLFGRGLEDYVNRTVTAAYNEITGQVIIIG